MNKIKKFFWKGKYSPLDAYEYNFTFYLSIAAFILAVIK